jgi:hypothetical protein
VNQSSDITALDQAHALGTALDGLATALASGDPDAVLQAEPPLAAAIAACARPAATTDDPAALRAAVTRASQLLARCRTSGAALAAVLETTLGVLGRDGAYDRQGGRPATGSIRRHDLHARV